MCSFEGIHMQIRKYIDFTEKLVQQFFIYKSIDSKGKIIYHAKPPTWCAVRKRAASGNKTI